MKKIKLSNEVYDILKWVVIIVLPAIATFIGTLGSIWQWDIPVDQIVKSIAAVEVLLGALVGISCINYNKEIESDKEEV